MSLESGITALQEQLQAHADIRAKHLTGYGPTREDPPVRDANADAIAQLAEAVRYIAGHPGL